MNIPANDLNRNIVLAINDVEPGLVSATKKLGKILDRALTGLVLIDATYYKNNPSFYRDKTGFFKEVIVDFDDPAELSAAIKPCANQLLLATCRVERSIQFFAKAIPLLPEELLLPTVQSLHDASEKEFMRAKINEYNPKIGTPFVKASEFSQSVIDEVSKKLKYPVIIKPSGLASSILVERCDSEEELKTALKSAFKHINEVYARDFGRGNKTMLIEQSIFGDMYSIDAYVDNEGKVSCLPLVHVVTAESIGKPGFYSYEHGTHIPFKSEEVGRAESAVKDALDALGLRNSTAHVELFHNHLGWQIIEVGARIGGYRESIYREAYNLDHYLNDLLIRVGLEPIISHDMIQYAGGINIYAEEEGIIESITGVEEASKVGSVVYLQQCLKPGDKALFASAGGEFVVDGILANPNKEQLAEDFEKVRELVSISIKPFTD